MSQKRSLNYYQRHTYTYLYTLICCYLIYHFTFHYSLSFPSGSVKGPVLLPLIAQCLSRASVPFPRLLLAHELVYERRAAFALDVAAPVKLAVATLVFVGLELVVATTAAHELAAVHALRGLVAQAALGAQRAGGLVPQAVVRAGVRVDQVLARRGVKAVVDQLQLAPSADAHGGGAVVLLLQELSHATEVGQLEPTGFQAA